MILPIVKGPDPRLYQTSRPVDLETDLAAIQDLVDTFRATPSARGLAAVQVGHLIRACVLRTNAGKEIVLVNPKARITDDGSSLEKERCLSFPWIAGVNIPRPYAAVVQWTSLVDAKPVGGQFSGIDLRCILHEIDHMDGVTIESYRRRK